MDPREAARRRLTEGGPVAIIRRSDEEEAEGRGGPTASGIDPDIREPHGDEEPQTL